MTGHANENSPNDYDDGSEREHRELLHIVSATAQRTTSNSFLGFPVWSFPTSTEQIMLRHAFTVNNFHNCQVMFSVIKGQYGSPKSSDQH